MQRVKIRQTIKTEQDEENIPTFDQEESEQARFPQENVHCQWQKGAFRPPSQRPQKTDRL